MANFIDLECLILINFLKTFFKQIIIIINQNKYKMEGNILSLLQGDGNPTDQTQQSKWKQSKLKHDVLSNKKDFPLANAKPSK